MNKLFQSLLFACIAVNLVSCAATKKTQELNEWYSQSEKQSIWQANHIKGSYRKSHANYLTIKKLNLLTGTHNIQPLSEAFEKMSAIESEYSSRLKTYQEKAHPIQAIWQSTDKITEGEDNWSSTETFITYSNQELTELDQLYNQYLTAESEFNSTLNSREFEIFSRRLPKTDKAIDRVLAEYQREQEKQKYTLTFNQTLITNMQEAISKSNLSFEAFLDLANKEDFIKKQQSLFQRPSHLRRTNFVVSDNTHSQLDSVLEQHLNKDSFVLAATSYSQKITTAQQASKELPLIGETSNFKSINRYLSSSNQTKINQIFQVQRTRLFDRDIIQTSEISLNQIAQRRYTPTEQLKRRIQHHLTFTKQYKDLLDQPEIQQHLDQAQQQRIALLDQIKKQRLQMIRNAASFNELNFFYQEVVTIDDTTTAPAMALKAAQKHTYQKVTEFKPTDSSENLDVNSFNSANLALKTELTGLYLGDFSNSRLTPNTTLSSMLFSNYLKAYSNICPQYLPKNKVPITKAVCDTERVTKNGWGQVVSRNCIKWADVPTGMYADPKLYQASIEQSRQAGLKLIGSALLSSDITAKFSAFRDEQTLQSDMRNLIKNNQCNNAGLQRFEDNLYRFTTKQKPLTLKRGTQLADLAVFYQADLNHQNINTQQLANALVKENAKTWLMNRYSDRSLQLVNTSSNPEDNSINEILASYRYGTAFGGGYNGKVRITFADKMPECLYFSDNAHSCRPASKIITNQYERGRYNK